VRVSDWLLWESTVYFCGSMGGHLFEKRLVWIQHCRGGCWWWRWVWFYGFWMLKNNIGFFGFWHRKQNQTEPKPVSWNRVRFDFGLFFQNFSLVVFIGKNRIEPKMITPSYTQICHFLVKLNHVKSFNLLYHFLINLTNDLFHKCSWFSRLPSTTVHLHHLTSLLALQRSWSFKVFF